MKIRSALLATVVALAPAIASAQHTPIATTAVDKEKGKVTLAEAVELQGAVTAIDKKNRVLTIKGGDGNIVTHLFEDGLDGAVILGRTRKSTVQIHQMQAACTGIHPLAGHGRGVFTKGGGLVHIALLEANAVAVFEINRGNQDHVSGA